MTKTVYINFYEPITPDIANHFVRFITDVIAHHQPTGLYFMFSSGGGNVEAGFYLHNYIMSLHGGLEITMHNTGTTDSIASLVFMAGAKRKAAPGSIFLLHGVTWNFGNIPASKSQLREVISTVDNMEESIAKSIASRSSVTQQEMMALFQQGENKNAEFALGKGIVHEIEVPSVPSGSIHLAFPPLPHAAH